MISGDWPPWELCFFRRDLLAEQSNCGAPAARSSSRQWAAAELFPPRGPDTGRRVRWCVIPLVCILICCSYPERYAFPVTRLRRGLRTFRNRTCVLVRQRTACKALIMETMKFRYRYAKAAVSRTEIPYVTS